MLRMIGTAGFPRVLSIAAILLLTVLFQTTSNPAHAKYASFVIDADTGEVLHATNAETRNYPASLTKMMTLYMIFDRLESKRWSPKTKLKVSRRAARQPASKLGLVPGTTITVEQAVLALIVKSANDVATAVAENYAGKERSFALKMTAKARSLGMSKTTFRNASGLPHRAQLSTAKDMSILARALIRDFPQYYRYFSSKTFRWAGRTYRTHNKLLKTYKGADGFKTGYIRASGFNLVTSATRGGRRLIGVVFGGRSSKHRNRHMASLMDKGFRKLNKGSAPVIASRDTKSTSTASKRTPSGPVVWAVQVGAFSKVHQAKSAAEKALKKARKYLSAGQIKIVPLTKRNGKRLHRARIVGISKSNAYRTCRILRDCMELSYRKSAELAQSVN